MKYTIAIPTYNNEKTIAKAIDSAINQNTKLEFEILVVNNNSSDNTQCEINKLINENIRVINNKNTVSLFENHNICLKEAKGEYVLFCHSDDILDSYAIDILDNILDSYGYPKKIVAWGRSLFRDFSYNLQKTFTPINTMISGEYSLKMFESGGLTPSGTCYSRITFLENGGFLPMRNKITPSDMSSMLNFALSGANFIMYDRIIFKREYASTAKNITQAEAFSSVVDALEELSERLTENKKQRLVEIACTIGSINLMYFMALKLAGFHITRKQLIRAKTKWLTQEGKNILKIFIQPFTCKLFLT